MIPSPKEIATIPNAISAVGFGLVLKGLREGLDTRKGAEYVFFGRVMDLIDGPVARATGQTSEFGAGVDAGLDKLGVAAILAHEAKMGIAPKSVIAGIVVQNTANVVATGIAKSQDPDVDLAPTKNGKRAMFGQNMSLGFYSLSAMFRETSPRASKVTRVAGHACAIAGIAYYGSKATSEYVSRIQEASELNENTYKN